MPGELTNPMFLYRYRPLTRDGERDVIGDEIELIRNGFIWLSNPKDLNDPFDCRPICTTEQEGRLDELLAKFLVGSLSAVSPDQIMASPMWSYYANGHRGICIEFPISEAGVALRKPIERVRYSNTRFDIRGLDPRKMRITSPCSIGVVVPNEEIIDASNNIDILELTRKSEAWRLEEEWRYIWPQNNCRPPEILVEERKIYGPGAEHMAHISKPTRVIFGANMGLAEKRRLGDSFKGIGIPTVEARRSATECRIDY